MNDICAAAIAVLSASLGCRVSAHVPAERPARLVTLTRSGGPRGEAIDEPVLEVQCWDETWPGANDLADAAEESLRGLAAEYAWVSRVEVDSRAEYPDQSGPNDIPRIVLSITAVCHI